MSAVPDAVPPVQPVTDADYKRMVEAVGDYAIFMLDAEGRIASWNRGAQLAKGYTADEIIGRHFSVFYPQDRIDEGWPEQELALTRRHGRIEDEGWRLRKDGSRFWASVVITALFDEAGNVRGYTKVTRDLTERRRHEELLRLSEERFRLMVESVRDYAIFMLDPEGRVATWNLGAQLTKGYLAEEILGRHFSVFYTPEDIARDWPSRELALALRDGRFEDEGWRLRKDGSRFWANVVITALHDAEGRHVGFAKVTRDLTQRQRIDELQDEGRQLTRFLAVLGHELRNPLSAIANAVSVMELEEPANPRIRRIREVLGRQVGQLKRLVDDLLDVGRIVGGKVRLERMPVLLQDVAAMAIEAVTPEMDAHRHMLRRDLTSAPLWVKGDRARLVQVLTNLLQNAAKFTPDGGEVRVALRRGPGQWAELVVADNGPGIPPDRLQLVFKLFAQGEDNHASRQHGGLGIGLSLVQQMVTRHGGGISAFSSGEPGKGVEFVVSLPLVEPPA